MRYPGIPAALIVTSAFVCLGAISSLANGAETACLDKPDVSKTRQNANKSSPKTEFAMQPGMRIEATNKVGTIVITAIDDYTRSYTWEGTTRPEELSPRMERWYGSLGLIGDRDWEKRDGISRGVFEEGQQHFKTAPEALAWLKARTYTDYVYRDDGLVVGWGKNLSREQLDVEVWQLMIDGKKPTGLAGSRNDKVKVSHVEIETSPLVKAVKKNDLGAVRELLRKGADPNVKDSARRPVLLVAVKNGRIDLVKALVERKADVNARDDDGSTCLLLTDDVSIITMLLDAGADVNAAYRVGLLEGLTPLIKAAMDGDSDVLTLLLKRGAEPDTRTEDGTTALMMAAMEGKTECVKRLLKGGADVNAKNDNGKTALYGARLTDKSEVIKVLKDAGAKE